MARRIGACVGFAIVVFFALTTIVSAATFFVGGCGSPNFPTIQLAVLNALPLNSAHTINICAGTYTENVAIGARKGLTFVGAGIASTTVSGAGTSGPIFNFNNSGINTIKLLTIDGGSTMTCSPAGAPVYGVKASRTTLTVTDAVVQNTRDAAGTCQGVGISAQTTGLGQFPLTVQKSTIKNFNRAGISGDSLVKATILNNIITGPPTTPNSWAPNGIELSRNAVGKVEGNTVKDIVSPVDSEAGSGIIMYCSPGGTSVQSNTVSNADIGIALVDTRQAIVRVNTVSDSGTAYTIQFIGTLFGPTGCPLIPAEQNQLLQNTATNNGFDGIALANFAPDVVFGLAPPRGNKINNNVITTSGFSGIVAFQGAGNSFSKNQMSGSGPSGWDAEDQLPVTPNTWTGNICNTPGREQNQPNLCQGL